MGAVPDARAGTNGRGGTFRSYNVAFGQSLDEWRQSFGLPLVTV